MLLPHSLELADGSYARVWTDDEAYADFLRLEVFDDLIAITWSTCWDINGFRTALEHATKELRAGSRVLRFLKLSGDPPLKLSRGDMTATVTRGTHSVQFPGCGGLIEDLRNDGAAVTFARCDGDGFALAWASEAKIHGWDGPTMGVIAPQLDSQYMSKLLRASGTERIRAESGELLDAVEEQAEKDLKEAWN